MGIWATCAMKKEAKSIGDLRDLFQEVRLVILSSQIYELVASFTRD